MPVGDINLAEQRLTRRQITPEDTSAKHSKRWKKINPHHEGQRDVGKICAAVSVVLVFLMLGMSLTNMFGFSARLSSDLEFYACALALFTAAMVFPCHDYTNSPLI